MRVPVVKTSIAALALSLVGPTMALAPAHAAGGPTAAASVVNPADPFADFTVAIVGEPRFGESVTAVPSGHVVTLPDGTELEGTVSYEWRVGGVLITSNTTPSLAPVLSDIGKTVMVTATVSLAGHPSATHSMSSERGVLGGKQINATAPKVLGTAKVGQRLTFTAGTPHSVQAKVRYQWYVDGTPVEGAAGTALGYTPSPDDIGKRVTIRATHTLNNFETLEIDATPTGPVVPGDIAVTAVIKGSPAAGEVLTAEVTRTPVSARVGYQWYVARDNNLNGTAIEGATGSTFTLDRSHVGAHVWVRIDSNLAGYTSSAVESAPVGPVSQGLQNWAAPTISGTATIGSVLTAAIPTLDVNTEASYVWNRNGTPIVGADKRTYTATVSDLGARLSVTVTYRRDGYADLMRTSTQTATITNGDLPTFRVGLTGTAKVDQTLTAKVDQTLTASVSNTGTGTPAGRLSYVWRSGGAVVAGAVGTTFKLRPEDAGKTVTVTVTQSLEGYLDRIVEATSSVVANGTLTGTAPNITGSAVVGQVLTISGGTVWSADADVSRQWRVNGVAVEGATGTSYTVRAEDSGKRITLTTLVSLPGYNDLTLTSSMSAAVAKATFDSLSVDVSGAMRVDGTLTARHSVSPAGSVKLQWKANGIAIAGATDSILQLTPALAGKTITLSATATLNGFADRTETATAGVVAKGTLTGTAPTIKGEAIAGTKLTAVPGTAHSSSVDVSYRWTADNATVATGRTITLTSELLGKTLRLVTTHSLAGYEDLVFTSSPSDPVIVSAFTSTDLIVSGTAKVGHTLVATTTAKPTASTVLVTWRRGDTVVGVGSTYVATPEDESFVLTATAEFFRKGYAEETEVWKTAPVANALAPDLVLKTSATSIRKGKRVIVSWTSKSATSVNASWSDTTVKAIGASTRKPGVGRHTYVVTATNANGATTASVTVDVLLPPKKLKVTTKKKVGRTKKFTVTISGLASREEFTLVYGQQKIRGVGKAVGVTKIVLIAPYKTRAKETTVRVTGSIKDRVGASKITITTPTQKSVPKKKAAKKKAAPKKATPKKKTKK
ncbi:hypothetical protein [Nocardioides yefusunii]|uniref:Ig-like domain-containing protein n=1 Tax=Nocardioides yefusunii TaxID=2500546 RepID=A0ABW1QZ47_9ACTN|nr:hypothetical protein [Nocardioides yefusunii]